MFLRKKIKSFIHPVLIVIFLAVFSVNSFSQRNYTGEPVTKNGIIKALKLRQFQTSDIVKIINEQGVEFKLTDDIEKDLVEAGARPELLEAVRRNFRGALKVKPTTNKPNSYDGLVSKAINLYESENNANEAISILNQAVALDPNKYPAYQMLGHVTLYGKKDFKKAEEYMRKAMDLGGSAVFRIKHAHDYNFVTYCDGSLYISRNTVRFESYNNEHTFDVRDSEIVKIETQDKLKGFITLKVFKGGIFHLVIRNSKGKDEKKYQFSPQTGKDDESKMIIRLIGK